MHHLSLHPRRALQLALALLVSVPLTASAATYGGRAFNVLIDLPTLGVTNVLVSDTGSLPPAGGTLTSEVLNALVTGPPIAFIPILDADVATDSVEAAGGLAEANSEVLGLDLLPSKAYRITASVVRSEAASHCVWNTGSSHIVGLTFGGLAVVVTGQKNQVVGIPGVATLTINEQIESNDPNTASISVNALHLRLVTGDEVIVSHSETLVDNCPGPLPVAASSWSLVKARLR
jgi:hypothetical protein